jgi:hypothetical protein
MDPISLEHAKEGFSALKNLVDIVKSFLPSGKANKNKLDDSSLNKALIDAQSAILAMQDLYAALLDEKQELKKKVAQLEAWDEEKEDYELRELAPGVLAFAYAPKGESTQPFHWLCEKCFQENKKAILQSQNQLTQPMMRCSACRTVYHLPPPPPPFGRIVRG